MEPSSPLRARLPSSFITQENLVRQSTVASNAGQLNSPIYSHELQRQAALFSDIDWGIRLLLMASAMTTCMGDAK